MTDMISYFQNSGAAADGLHNRLSGVFWWAWNSNAGKPLQASVCLCCSAHWQGFCQLTVPGPHTSDSSHAALSPFQKHVLTVRCRLCCRAEPGPS